MKRRATAIFGIHKRTFRRPASFSATSRPLRSKRACGAPSIGTARRKPRPTLRLRPRPGPRPLPQRPEKSAPPRFLRQADLSVAEWLAGFRRVVVPEEERLELFLFRPDLVQRVALEQFPILHDPVDAVRVVDVVERVLVQDQQIGKFPRLDRTNILRTPNNL